VDVGADALLAEDVSTLQPRQHIKSLDDLIEWIYISLHSFFRNIRTTRANHPFKKLLLTQRLQRLIHRKRMSKSPLPKRHHEILFLATLSCFFSPSFRLLNPQLALLVERLGRRGGFETREAGFQFVDVFEGPGFFDGLLQHEGVGGALSEAQELHHEDAVVAAGFALHEEGVKVCAEAVFGLFLDQFECSRSARGLKTYDSID
jgi:hypothetical protein